MSTWANYKSMNEPRSSSEPPYSMIISYNNNTDSSSKNNNTTNNNNNNNVYNTLKRSRKISSKKGASLKKPERQIFGLVTALIFLFASFILAIHQIYLAVVYRELYELAVRILWFLSFSFTGLFYFSIITKPEYLGGEPDNDKMLPLLAAAIMRSVAHFIYCSFKGPFSDVFLYIMAEMVIVLIYKRIYFLKDDTGGFFLCFKPWIIRSIPISDAIIYNQRTKSSQLQFPGTLV